MATNNFLAIPEKYLKTDVLTSDSVFKLQDIKWYTDNAGNDVILLAANFGSSNVGYGVHEPRTARQEFFTWDTSQIALFATTGIPYITRGLPWGADYTTGATARRFFHPSGSKTLLFTDAPSMWNTMANKANDETITGKYTFPNNGNYPLIGGSYVAPTSDLQIATKKYVDDVAVAGAPNATETVKGIVELATPAEQAAGTSTGSTGARLVIAASNAKSTSAGAADANKVPVLDSNGRLDQTLMPAPFSASAANVQVTTDAANANDAVRYSRAQSMVSANEGTGVSGEIYSVGTPLYLKASDGRLYKTIGTGDESTYSFIGFALDASAGVGVAGLRFAKPSGIATGLSGLTAGSYYYITDTAGTIATTPGSRTAKVGQALSATTLRVCEPKFFKHGNLNIASQGANPVTLGFFPSRINVFIRLPNGYNALPGGVFGREDNTGWAFVHDTGAQWVENGATNHLIALTPYSGTPTYYLDITRTASGFILTASASTGGSFQSLWVDWEAFSE